MKYHGKNYFENCSIEELNKIEEDYKSSLRRKEEFYKNYDNLIVKYVESYKFLGKKVAELNTYFNNNFEYLELNKGFIFNEKFYDIKANSTKSLDIYFKKYNQTLVHLKKLVKLNNNLNSIPFFLKYDDREPTESMGIDKIIIDINVYGNKNIYHGGPTGVFPLVTSLKKSTYLHDLWIRDLELNAKKFYNKLLILINEVFDDLDKEWNFLKGEELEKKKLENVAEKIKNGYFLLNTRKFDKEIFKIYLNSEKIDIEKKSRLIELTKRRKDKRSLKAENIGYVYILSNKAYPNVYKIGSTYGLPEERAEELTGTGHLDPFRVEFSISILNAEFFEKLTHSSLKKYRIKRNREFFKVDIKLIKETLRQIQLKSNNGKKKIKSVGNLLSK